MIRLLTLFLIISTAFAQQAVIQISNTKLDGTACTKNSECPGGDPVCTTGVGLWGNAGVCIKRPLTLSSEDSGATYTQGDPIQMLTQLANDGSDSNCTAGADRDKHRCTTYTVHLQTASVATGCSLSVTDPAKVSLTELTGTFVGGGKTYNAQNKYSCSFSPQNELYLGDAGVTLVFTDLVTTTVNNGTHNVTSSSIVTRHSLALTFKVKRGPSLQLDPTPSDGELLEIFAGASEPIGARKAVHRGNSFLFNYHLRDKRYKAKDQSGRLEATGSHSVNLEATGILANSVLTSALSAYGYLSDYEQSATAIRISDGQACESATFEEAADTVCPLPAVYDDYVLYLLDGTFSFTIDLPAFHNNYINTVCTLCSPTLHIKVPSLSVDVRDALIGSLANEDYSFSIDTIAPNVLNMKGTIENGDKLYEYYSLESNTVSFPSLYSVVDLIDASGGDDTTVSDDCNIASKQVYEVLSSSYGGSSMSSMFYAAQNALDSSSCNVTTTVALGGTVGLSWGASETLIKDDGVTLKINSRFMTHDSLNVLRGSDVELTGAKTVLKDILGNAPNTDYKISGVVDIGGTEITQDLTTTQDDTDLTTYSTGCNGYFDIQFKRSGALTLQYSLRVPCTRGTGAVETAISLKSIFTSTYSLSENILSSVGTYGDEPDGNVVVKYGTCVASSTGADGIELKAYNSGLSQSTESCTTNTLGFAQVADQKQKSDDIGVDAWKACAYFIDLADSAVAYTSASYVFDTTLAMLHSRGAYTFCADQTFRTTISLNNEAAATTFEFASPEKGAALSRTATVISIEWVECTGGGGYHLEIDVLIEETVGTGTVTSTFDQPVVSSGGNDDALTIGLVGKTISMDSVCVPIILTDTICSGTEYGKLKETKTTFVLSGAYDGASYDSNVVIETNYDACPVDAADKEQEITVSAALTCDGGACPKFSVEDNEVASSAILKAIATITGGAAGVWKPQTLDIHLDRIGASAENLGNLISSDHVCDCGNIAQGCIAKNNNFGFLTFNCAVISTGGSFEFDALPLSGYYDDSKFSVRLQIVAVSGTRRLRRTILLRSDGSQEIEDSIDLRVLPASIVYDLVSEPSSSEPTPSEPTPVSSPVVTSAPVEAKTMEITEVGWAAIIVTSLSVVVLLGYCFKRMCDRTDLSAVGLGPEVKYHAVRQTRFKNIRY
jgi:hypothetical protein